LQPDQLLTDSSHPQEKNDLNNINHSSRVSRRSRSA
jgi:hypothetical protein